MLFSSASAAFAATNPSKSATTTTASNSESSTPGNNARRNSDVKSDKPNGRSQAARITSVFRPKTTSESKAGKVSLDPKHESTSSTPYSKPESTDGEEQQCGHGPKWVPFPSSTPTALADKLNEMYWSATHSEVKRVILTLRDWDRSGVVFEEETALEEFDPDKYDDDAYKGINGFETFLEQVYGESRDFANRYCKMRYKRGHNTDLITILAERIQTEVYYSNLLRLKYDVKASLKLIERKKENRDERRARLLLQSLSLLDIDKLVEYQECEVLQPSQRPSEASSSRKGACVRGPSPQIRFLGVGGETGNLKLGVGTCAGPGCASVLRGVMFSQTKELTEFICEECFWLAKANGNADRKDEFGNEVALFPVDSQVLHNGSAANDESGGFDGNENWCVSLTTDYCTDGFDGAHGDAGDCGGGDGDGGGGDGGDGGGGGCGGGGCGGDCGGG